jgi:hypothetical protein|uniref:DUF7305 domain-containing protein n=1 Tax=Cephaloticoccus sp. TaxID=1985742 RepID=UPI00404B2D66
MKPFIFNRIPQSTRGEMLIVAMLISAIIAISLGTLMNLSITSLRLADRTFYSNAAMNLVEMGVEEAMWSFQDDITSGSGWVAWDTSTGTVAKVQYGTFGFSGGVTGVTKVYVTDYTGLSLTPVIISRALITLPTGAPIEKWIEITLLRRSKFELGIVAKGSITFSGTNASVDSWESDPGNDGIGIVPYSGSVATDSGSIGSISVSSTISVNNADIWGTAATGAASAAAIGVGPNGVIGPYGTAAGTKDAGSVSTDFTANLVTVTSPTGGTVISAIGTTTALGSGTYRIPSVTLAGSDSLAITGNVIIVITATSGTTGISLTGNANITLASGATLKIYAESNLSFSGKGVINPNTQPSSVQIWGTSTNATPQTIALSGNGSLSAITYAPNGNVSINGNGEVYGSVIANEVNVTGNANFHYDKTLRYLNTGDPYGITKWRELTSAADRAAYSALMNS